MAKGKNQKKVAFYKQRRRGIPGITDAELLAMWNKKVADEKAVEDAKKAEVEAKLSAELTAKKALEDSKKAEVEAKEATKDPEPNVVDGAISS